MRPLVAATVVSVLFTAPARAQVVTASHWDQDQGFFGEFIADIGDINGDGIHELFCGEPRWDGAATFSAGRAWVIDPVVHYLIYLFDGTQTGAQWGSSACSLGDVEGDGYGDFAVSARYWNSAAYADAGKIVGYSGKTGAVLWTLEGNKADEELGTELAWIGDIDKDGVDEFAATRPNDGEVALFDALGQKKLNIVRGPNTEFAAAIARCEDLDQDGFADVLVGEPGYDLFFPPQLDCGRVVAYSSVTGNSINEWIGPSSGERLGSSVAGCGDIDGDGVAEFVTGSMETDKGYTDNGAITVVSGRTFTELHKIYGGDDGERLGLSVAGLRDINDDGIDDFIASAQDGGPDDVGQILLYSGSNGHLLWELTGTVGPNGDYMHLGEGLTAGDWNGDGFGDFAWGDPGYAADHGAGYQQMGSVHTLVGCPAWAERYGTGWPGRNGIPTLTALNDPHPGFPISVTITNSLGANTLALLMVGTSATNIPTSKGGTLLASSDFFSTIFTLDAAGTTMTEDIPSDPALYFADFYVQVLEADPFASKKISFTAGLNIHIGVDLL